MSAGERAERTLITQAILKLVGPCNLNCTYCYVYNHEDQGWRRRPKFVDDAVFEKMIAALRRHCDRHAHSMSLTFHGGEPTLLGARAFDRLVERAREIMGPRLAQLVMQTNGTLIDDSWVSVLRKHEICVGVSIDGPAEVHDAARVDHAGRGSHAAAVRGLQRLQDAGLSPGVLSVVNPGQSGDAAYAYLRSLGVTYLDFLLPDVSHDNKQRMYGQFGATPVADFLLPILHAWMREDDPDVRIRNFWDLFTLLLGGSGSTDAFANPAMSYVVVETDGSIEALDALRVCADGLASSGLNLLENELEELNGDGSRIRNLLGEGEKLCETCTSCPDVAVCGGGYLPHRFSEQRGFDNPSVWCEDIRLLLAAMRAYVDAKSAT